MKQMLSVGCCGCEWIHASTWQNHAVLLLLLAQTTTQAGPNIVAWGTYGSDPAQSFVPASLSNAIAIATAHEHSLALKGDGTVLAWGPYNGSAEVKVPADLTNAVAVAAGVFHSLALRTDGTVIAWGSNSEGQTQVPVDLTNVVAIAAGGSQSLALKADGTVVAWGDPGQSRVPAGLGNVVAIAAGDGHSLALKADGTVVGWGNNGSGQIRAPAWLTDVVAIAAGSSHSLGLRSDGTVVGWGLEPRVPRDLADVIAIAAGCNHSLAAKADGTVVGWGLNYGGQIDVPDGLTNALAVAAGYTLSLALLGDGPPLLGRPVAYRAVAYGTTVWLGVPAAGACPLNYQWRFNGADLSGATQPTLVLTNLQFNQAGVYSLSVSNGLGTAVSEEMVVDVLPLAAIVQPQNQTTFPGGTASFSSLVAGPGPLSCQWAFNGMALVGATNRILVLTNVQLNQAGQYTLAVSNVWGTATSAKASLSISLIAAWGGDYLGVQDVPADLTNVVALAGGGGLALKADGQVVTWGSSSASTTTPADLTNVVAVAGGGNTSLALKADGTVVAWGTISEGQTNVPSDLTDVVAIACHWYHCLALKADGTVIAWGRTTPGDSLDAWTDMPTDLANVVDIAAGVSHSVALRADGTVVAWGRNVNGETDVPADLTDVVAIAAGGYHNLALKADGTVVAWSGNWAGQSEVPANLTEVVAVAAGEGHSLALRADGTIVAWGDNRAGQSEVPVGLKDVAAVAAGAIDSLGLVGAGPPLLAKPLVSRTVAYGGSARLVASAAGAPPLSYQWRLNGTNLLGATKPVLMLTNVRFDQAGAYSVVVTNALGVAVSSPTVVEVWPLVFSVQPLSQQKWKGETVHFTATPSGQGPFIYQWQFNGVDLPGETNPSLVMTRVRLDQAGSYAVVARNPLGSARSANATLSVGRVAAWGTPGTGQTAVPPPDLTNIIAIAAGEDQNLALQHDGTVIAWDNTGTGQAGFVPPGLTNVVALAAGRGYGPWWFVLGSPKLALRADGTVVAWGRDGINTNDWFVPADLSNVVAVAAGMRHRLALREDGTVLAWGNELAGQSTNVPAGLTNAVSIAAGMNHSLALRRDGTVLAWGNEWAGQSTNVPAGLTNVVAIAAGNPSLALRADGTVVGWLEDGTNAEIPANLTNVQAVAAGASRSLALIGDGPPVIMALLGQPIVGTNGFSVSIPTQSGRVYALEYKNSLDDQNWMSLPLVAGTGHERTMTDPTVNGAQRFYRVRRW
jgi:alpha-tubulin suppressor-like RCC1 family protein